MGSLICFCQVLSKHGKHKVLSPCTTLALFQHSAGSDKARRIFNQSWFGLWMFPLHIQQLCLPASVLSPLLTSHSLYKPAGLLWVCLYAVYTQRGGHCVLIFVFYLLDFCIIPGSSTYFSAFLV